MFGSPGEGSWSTRSRCACSLAAPRRRALEIHSERHEHLPRRTVEGGQDAFAAESGADRRGAGRIDELAGERVLAQEVVARHDVSLVQQVLAVEADFVPVAGRAPDEVGVEQREALLVETRDAQFELLALAAIRQGRVRV